jgi:hypothetical protein
MRLGSLTDLKVLLEKTDTDHDTLLGIILDSVSVSFEGYTNRNFEKLLRTEYFDTGGKIFQVRAFPIDSAIATILIIDGTTYTVNDDYYIFTDKGYFEFSSDTIKTDPKEVSITYTGGYSWTTGSGRIDVPNDLMFACLTQSAYIFRNRKNIGQNSVTLPDGSVNVNNQDEFLPQVISVLDRYKI